MRQRRIFNLGIAILTGSTSVVVIHLVWYALPKTIKTSYPNAVPFSYHFLDFPNFVISAVISVSAGCVCGFLVWRRTNRPLVRAGKGLCAKCGYDLRGTPERCPECGARAGIPPLRLASRRTCGVAAILLLLAIWPAYLIRRWVIIEQDMSAVNRWEADFRAHGSSRNPGEWFDMVVQALMVAQRDGKRLTKQDIQRLCDNPDTTESSTGTGGQRLYYLYNLFGQPPAWCCVISIGPDGGVADVMYGNASQLYPQRATP